MSTKDYSLWPSGVEVYLNARESGPDKRLCNVGGCVRIRMRTTKKESGVVNWHNECLEHWKRGIIIFKSDEPVGYILPDGTKRKEDGDE